MVPKIDVFETLASLEVAAADVIASRIRTAVQDRGMSIIALSGGDTPRGVYRRLADGKHRNRVDWTRVHVCFGDERLVPPDQPHSNYGMVQTELLSRIPIPAENVHRIRGELTAKDAAQQYAVELKGLLRGKDAGLDLVLLGVGEDGHTSSLFPGTDVLDERAETVRAVYVPELNSWRVTMALPLLNSAREVIFLVAGKRKAEIVHRVLSARQPVHDLPATMIRPASGRVQWMLDAGAAAALGAEFIMSRRGT